MDLPRPDGPDVDIGQSLIATGWALYGLSGVVVGLRVYTQLKVTRNFGIGDTIMIMALICGLLHISFITIAHSHGLGRHFFYLTNTEKVQSIKYEYISAPFAGMSEALGRIAFIILIHDLFGTTTGRRFFLRFLIVESLIVNMVICVITIFIQCKDVKTLWDPFNHPSKCWNPSIQTNLAFFQGAINSLTDLILTIVPSIIIWTLQMKFRIKLGLVVLLSLSFLSLGACIIRTVEIKSLDKRSDYTYNTVSFMTWIVVENSIVIIVASIPLIRPLFCRGKTHSSGYEQNAYEMNSVQTKGSGAFVNS